MNAATAIVLAVVLSAVAVAVAIIVHHRRKAGTSACCGCALKDLCLKTE